MIMDDDCIIVSERIFLRNRIIIRNGRTYLVTSYLEKGTGRGGRDAIVLVIKLMEGVQYISEFRHIMWEQLMQLLVTHGYEVEAVVDEKNEYEANIGPASNEDNFSFDFLDDTDDLYELDKYLSDSRSQNCCQDNVTEFEELLSGPHFQAENHESTIDDVLNYLHGENDLISADLTEKNSFQLGQNEVNATIDSSQQEAGPEKVENFKSLWEDMAMQRDEFETFLVMPSISHVQAFTPERADIETNSHFPEGNDHQFEKNSFQFGVKKVNTDTTSTILPTRKHDQDSGKVDVKNKAKKRSRVDSKIGARPMGRPSKARKALEEYEEKVKQCRLEFAEMVEDQVKNYLTFDEYSEEDTFNTIVAETMFLWKCNLVDYAGTKELGA